MKHVTRMTIDDALHYTAEQREEIIRGYPEHEREARIKGIPSMGSGRIFPVPEADISIEPFQTPPHWAYIGGIDIGWEHPTAAVQLAWDRDNDVVAVISAYRRKHATPLEHAATLTHWGRNLPFAWPMDAIQRDKRTGQTVRQDYERAGLVMLAGHATHPDGGTSVEAGLMQILDRMRTGRFRVFSHLADWWQEFREYHRREGIIHKQRDDLMDATRYAMMMLRFAEPRYSLMEDEDLSQNTLRYGEGY